MKSVHEDGAGCASYFLVALLFMAVLTGCFAPGYPYLAPVDDDFTAPWERSATNVTAGAEQK